MLRRPFASSNRLIVLLLERIPLLLEMAGTRHLPLLTFMETECMASTALLVPRMIGWPNKLTPLGLTTFPVWVGDKFLTTPSGSKMLLGKLPWEELNFRCMCRTGVLSLAELI